MKRILVIDDNVDMCVLLDKFLTRKGFTVETAHTASKGIAKFKEQPFDLVLCDYRLGNQDGRTVIQAVNSIHPGTIVIIITGYADIRVAVEVIKMGAFDYIAKPLIPDEVLSVIEKASQQLSESDSGLFPPAVSKPANTLREESSQFFIGTDPATQELYRQIALVAPTNYNVIIYGESGTGKEVVARTIHQLSLRKNKPFVAVDCGTLSKELAVSELFGHVKGAFTGAQYDKEGQFEVANGGTLFLDEISNLSGDIQASLLRVVQERKLKRVGSTKDINLDIRVIVASNEDLKQAYQQGTFREDLYHRFNEFTLTITPLRNRQDDIPLFARFFLDQVNQELGKGIKNFDQEVLESFMAYSWPGNLREMRNVIRRAALLTATDTITPHSLPAEVLHGPILTKDLQIAPANKGALPGSALDLDLKGGASLAEHRMILEVLKQVNYNKTKAAELLKIDRKTLYNKLKGFI